MAYFGSDGNNDAAGINPGAVPEGVTSVDYCAQNEMRICGGQVGEAGTPTHVSIYLASYDGVTASNHYIAVYAGGSASSPDGASLLGTTANITANYGTTPGWQTFALTGTPTAWSASAYIWLAVLGRGADAAFGIRQKVVDASGSGTTYIEQWTNKGAGTYEYLWQQTGIGGTTPPATVGAVTQVAQMPFAGYITYTVGGSDDGLSPILIPQPLPGALGVYRSLRGRIG